MKPNRETYIKNADLFKQPEATDSAQKVFLIDKNFMKNLNYWINNSNSRAPTSYNESGFKEKLKQNDKAKLGVDFEAISQKGWEILQKDFNIQTQISSLLVKHPATNEPTILLDGVKLNIYLQNGTKKLKSCGRTWKIGDIKNQFCRNNGLDPNCYKLVYDTAKSENIDNRTAQICYTHKLVLVETNKPTNVLKDPSNTSSQKPRPTNNVRTANGTTSKIPIHTPSGHLSKRSTSTKDNSIGPKSTTTKNRFASPTIIQPNLSKHSEEPPHSPKISSNSSHNTSFGSTGIAGGNISSISNYDAKSLSRTTSSKAVKEPLPSLHTDSSPLSKKISAAASAAYGSYPKPVGLNNLGNTCYFNSAVQCLIRVKPLTDFVMSSKFESQINEHNKKGSQGRIARAYRDFIRQMATCSGSAQDPSNLRSALVRKYKRFANYSQHDSQELLGALLDGLHEDFNQAHGAGGNQPEIKVDENTDSWTLHISKNFSPIVDIFHGEFFSNTECPLCNYISSVHDPFMFMSVPVPNKSYGSVKLEDCLSSFEQVDKLDADNKWECGGCHKKVCATKRIGIFRCAEILIIHLKRFSGSGYFSSKIETEVKYPDELDTSPFVSEGHGARYQLIGAVFHSGSLGGGHYTSAALDQCTGHWYNFNDSWASPIDISGAHSRSAYIIFYQRM